MHARRMKDIRYVAISYNNSYYARIKVLAYSHPYHNTNLWLVKAMRLHFPTDH
jgi:hypothetical protein